MLSPLYGESGKANLNKNKKVILTIAVFKNLLNKKEEFIMKNLKMEVLETLETPSLKDVGIGIAIGAAVTAFALT